MRRLAALAAILLPLLALAGACPDRPVAAVSPRPAKETAAEVPVSGIEKVDILFVIDNSRSMVDEQNQLAANFPAFMEVLEGVEGGLPDVHIGVVSSDMGVGDAAWGCSNDGDRGTLQATARGACAPPVGEPWIVSSKNDDGSRTTNFSGTLPETFSCIARLGSGGCGYERHLDAMRAALDGRNPGNAGFVRDGALLVVIFIADEDDCSARDTHVYTDAEGSDSLTSDVGPRNLRCTEWGVTCEGSPLPRATGSYENCQAREGSPYLEHPSAYAQFLRELKGSDSLIMVAGVFGPETPFAIVQGAGDAGLTLGVSCNDPDGMPGEGAVPPIRFRSLFDQFGDSVMTSICGTDLTYALTEIAERIGYKVRSTCLADSVDLTDLFLDRPGLQPWCTVTEKTAGGAERVIGRCAMADETTPAADGARPCWYVAADGESCGGPGQSGYKIEIARDVAPPPETLLDMRCLGE